MRKFLLLSLFLIFAVACEEKQKSQIVPAEAPGLTFSEWSAGLPLTEQWREGLGFFDLNGDGHLDIVAPPPRVADDDRKNVYVWHGDGAGKWSEHTLAIPIPLEKLDYGSIDIADFNGDSVPDAVMAIHTMGIRFFKGSKEGEFLEMSKGIPSADTFASRALVVDDFNNDGRSDFAAVMEFMPNKPFSGWGGLLICSWQEDRWQCRNLEEGSDRALLADLVVSGDVNGDGNKDIAVASLNHLHTKIIWLGDGKGNFKPFNEGLPTKMHYNSVDLADINKDGKDDLIVSISFLGKDVFKGIKVFLSGPDGFIDDSDGLPSGEQWAYAAAAGDLNGDDNLEIVVAPKEGGLKVFQKDGKRWREIANSGLPKDGLRVISRIYCIDLNKDDREEIVVNYARAHDDTGGIRVFKSNSK